MHRSIINYSDIQNASRLDAEFFQSKFLKLQKKLDKGKYNKLGEVCDFINTGPSGSNLLASAYAPSGIKILRPSNLNGWNCDNGNFVFISEENLQKNNLKIYKNKDILIARIGDIKFGIIEGNARGRLTVSPNLFVLRLKKDLMDPYFLLAFFHTMFGFPQIQQGKKLASLASVGINQVANMLISAISLKEQKKIGNTVRTALKKIQLAKIYYSRAENVLLQKAGFLKTEKAYLSTVVSVLQLRYACRADAEYFLYKSPGEKIKSIQLGEIAQIFRGIEPGSRAYQKSGKLFLRVSNISKYGLLAKSQKYIRSELYERLRKKYQPQINEILLTKDGKPGVALVVDKPIEGIVSEGIIRLKPKSGLTPEYISLCINSFVCQSQIRIDKDGSLVPHWKIDQIKKLRIPVLPFSERKSIADDIKKSSALFQESKNNLSQAIKQVEFLINNAY